MVSWSIRTLTQIWRHRCIPQIMVVWIVTRFWNVVVNEHCLHCWIIGKDTMLALVWVCLHSFACKATLIVYNTKYMCTHAINTNNFIISCINCYFYYLYWLNMIQLFSIIIFAADNNRIVLSLLAKLCKHTHTKASDISHK